MKFIIYWYYSLRPFWQMSVLLLASVIIISLNAGPKLAPLRETMFAVNELASDFAGYFTTNTELQKENRALKKQLIRERLAKNYYIQNAIENRRLKNLLKLEAPEGYSLLFAGVIAESPFEGIRGLVINKGRVDSIARNDVVLTINGIAGKVVEVMEHSALVETLMDRNLQIAASLVRNQERGILKYYDNRVLLLDYIVKSVDVRPGDIIVTAPTSQIYPPGLIIGKVVKVESKTWEHFQRIYVLPDVNFNKLNEVMILKENERKN